ncbi:MAG: acyloxyacyl hydrolase [Polaribacter sp.]
MKKTNLIFGIFFFTVFTINSQEDKKGIFNIKKLGFLYNYGTEENFIFNDKDYAYSTNTYKLQAFYNLGNWKGLKLELIVQPQVQFIKHQLLNEWFVTPDQDNFKDKIAEFIQPKNINLYGLEFGFAAKKNIFKKIDLQATISLGFSYINKRSERLAEGFTFIENFSLGFSYNFIKKSYLYIGTNFGHVSNLNFQKPNDGYNVLGIEVGYSFILQ